MRGLCRYAIPWGTFTLCVLLLFGCADSSNDVLSILFSDVTGKVTNGDGTGIANVTVYLVPVGKVKTTPITGADLASKGSAAEAYDEPLEDIVSQKGNTFQRATTNSRGEYTIRDVASGDYFFYAKPANNDTEYLPGGDICRVAKDRDNFVGTTVNIRLSSSPTSSATYIGTSQCLNCHSDHSGYLYHAHRQGISVAGVDGGLQKRDNFPDFSDALDNFTAADAYTDAGVTMLTVGDYDGTRGFDKFVVYEDPLQVTTEFAKFYLWQDNADGLYKITITNSLNAADPNSPLTLTVRLTYGGTVFKQRFLVEVPAALATRLGRYPLLQYQAFPGKSRGSESNYDRARVIWRDYHLDWWWDAGVDTVVGTADDVLKAPSTTKTFEAKCATCHSTGFTMLDAAGLPVTAGDPGAPNAVTGEFLSDAVDDTQGAFDLDGDGTLDEVNIGCETCHGPGSRHRIANNSRFIVAPAYLSPSRSNMLCGVCHDRSAGIGSAATPDLQNGDMLFDANNRLPSPGDSRAEIISDHLSRPGPKLSHMWADETHSTKHHQHYPDFLKSKHYRNDTQLLVCSDCHDPHADRSRQGLQEYPHNLLYDPADPESKLCSRCHAFDPLDHMEKKTGSDHAGLQTLCSDCHMPRTGKTGAGMSGRILSTATLPPASDADQYWMNDISSHVFDFVRKTAEGVAGETPGRAMPAPYTNQCGTCHDVDTLQYMQPSSKLDASGPGAQ